jgi:hypothetical protein
MADRDSSDLRADMLFMLVAAGVFAYFGFGSSWAHQFTNPAPPAQPQWLPMVAVLEWTLKGGAIAFGAAAALTMMRVRLGAVLYAGAGVLTAVLFIAIAIWHWTNPNGYYCGVPPILLVIFAAWNGYGSIAALLAMARPAAATQDMSSDPRT